MSDSTEPAMVDYRDLIIEAYRIVRPYLNRWLPKRGWPQVIDADGSNFAEVARKIYHVPTLLAGSDPRGREGAKVKAVVIISQEFTQLVYWAAQAELMKQSGDHAEYRAAIKFARVFSYMLTEDLSAIKRLERYDWFTAWFRRRS